MISLWIRVNQAETLDTRVELLSSLVALEVKSYIALSSRSHSQQSVRQREVDP